MSNAGRETGGFRERSNSKTTPSKPAPIRANPPKAPPSPSSRSGTAPSSGAKSSFFTPPPGAESVRHQRQISDDIPPPPPPEEPAPATVRVSSKVRRSDPARMKPAVVQSTAPKEWQQRFLTLAGKRMTCGKKGGEHPIDINMQGATVVCDPSDPRQPRFAILSPNAQSAFYLLTTPPERDKWLYHFTDQGATIITPPAPKSSEVEMKGWLKILSPSGTDPAELDFLAAHAKRVMGEKTMANEMEIQKLEVLAGQLSELELNKIKLKVSKLEADNLQLNTVLAKQKKTMGDLEAKNGALQQHAVTHAELAVRATHARAMSIRRLETSRDEEMSELVSTNARLQQELEAAQAQAAQAEKVKQLVIQERDEALDLVEAVEKTKGNMEASAEELLADLTREKQEREKQLRKAREELARLREVQLEGERRAQGAEEALAKQVDFVSSAEELIAELTRAKEVSEEKLRRAEDTIKHHTAALTLPASTRHSIFIPPQALMSETEKELMSEKMVLLDEMCIQKEEFDNLKRAYDALVAETRLVNENVNFRGSIGARQDSVGERHSLSRAGGRDSLGGRDSFPGGRLSTSSMGPMMGTPERPEDHMARWKATLEQTQRRQEETSSTSITAEFLQPKTVRNVMDTERKAPKPVPAEPRAAAPPEPVKTPPIESSKSRGPPSPRGFTTTLAASRPPIPAGPPPASVLAASPMTASSTASARSGALRPAGGTTPTTPTQPATATTTAQIPKATPVTPPMATPVLVSKTSGSNAPPPPANTTTATTSAAYVSGRSRSASRSRG